MWEISMRKLPLSFTWVALWFSLICVQTNCSRHHIGQAPVTQQTPTAPSSQTDISGQTDHITRPTSEPYSGDLAIFEDPGRGRKLQINRVMDLLSINKGSNVADIGAGSGWFTMRAARRVGSNGIVYAVEINPDYINYIEKRARRERLPNVRTVTGKEDDPQLSEQSLDAALILNTYHEVAQPISLLEHLRMALRPSAKLGIIDRNGNGDDHGLGMQTLIDEAKRAGFSLVAQYDFVKPGDMDYFLIFSH